jgi:DNA polymerase-3 subunit gamma/tau
MATIYRKYRPQVFGEVFGQEHIIETLKKALELDRVAHAYLFTGARGVGKTTVARILAKAVNCLADKNKPCGKCANCKSISEGKFMDLIEIDAASNRGIDEIRQLRDKIQFAPSVGKKRVYIIDEVHMLTREAFNALLKTLEEPPEHTIFIFATTEAHKVPVTVLSRCQRFDFQLADEDLIKTSLKKVAAAEEFAIADEVVDLIARTSGGSFRDSQSLLDQLSSHLVGSSVSLEQALNVLNLTSVQEVDNFIGLLQQRKAGEAIDLIEKLKNKGINFADFLAMTIIEVRRILIKKIKAGEQCVWESEVLQQLIDAQGQMKISPVESLPLELAVYGICLAEEKADQVIANGSAKGKAAVKDEAGSVKPAPPRPPKKPVMSKDLKMAIVDEVSTRKKTLGTLLATCSISEGKGEITITTEYPFHRDTITREQNLLLIEEVVGTIMDQRVKINCQVQKEEDIEEEIDSVFGE